MHTEVPPESVTCCDCQLPLNLNKNLGYSPPNINLLLPLCVCSNCSLRDSVFLCLNMFSFHNTFSVTVNSSFKVIWC